MLGDTSMGMINGYFGPRLLYPIGFSEHKVDQAWLIDRTRTVSEQRVDDAFRFVQDRGVIFHWREADAEDFTPAATREQLRGYLAVLDLLAEFQADCLGWQYQLGLLNRDICNAPASIILAYIIAIPIFNEKIQTH